MLEGPDGACPCGPGGALNTHARTRARTQEREIRPPHSEALSSPLTTSFRKPLNTKNLWSDSLYTTINHVPIATVKWSYSVCVCVYSICECVCLPVVMNECKKECVLCVSLWASACLPVANGVAVCFPAKVPRWWRVIDVPRPTSGPSGGIYGPHGLALAKLSGRTQPDCGPIHLLHSVLPSLHLHKDFFIILHHKCGAVRWATKQHTDRQTDREGGNPSSCNGSLPLNWWTDRYIHRTDG